MAKAWDDVWESILPEPCLLHLYASTYCTTLPEQAQLREIDLDYSPDPLPFHFLATLVYTPSGSRWFVGSRDLVLHSKLNLKAMHGTARKS